MPTPRRKRQKQNCSMKVGSAQDASPLVRFPTGQSRLCVVFLVCGTFGCVNTCAVEWLFLLHVACDSDIATITFAEHTNTRSRLSARRGTLMQVVQQLV
jgi:hypothetical protein